MASKHSQQRCSGTDHSANKLAHTPKQKWLNQSPMRMGFRKWIRLFPPRTVGICHTLTKDWLQAINTFMRGEEARSIKRNRRKLSEIPWGGTVQLNLLQHRGLESRSMCVKPKLLTCSSSFTDEHQLQQNGLSETCPEGLNRYLLAPRPLMVVLGIYVGHIHPVIVEPYEDTHGYLALYKCHLSGCLIAMKNFTSPYSPKETKEVLPNSKLQWDCGLPGKKRRGPSSHYSLLQCNSPSTSPAGKSFHIGDVG